LVLFLFAFLFHFSITSPAFLTSYYMPPVGLGCHSGSLVLYFAASFVAAGSLTFSTWLSKRYFQIRYQGNSTDPSPVHSWITNILAFFAVTTRLFGTGLAWTNAFWIIIYCMLEFIGVFQRCYCDCLVIVNGDNGWLSFLNTDQIEDAVLKYWIGSLILSLGVMIGTSFILWWLPRDYINFKKGLEASGD
jgi:hypothetical protein